MSFRAYKFKLRPTADQVTQFTREVGHARFVWNQMLQRQKQRLEAGQGVDSFETMSAALPGLKQAHPFLKEASSHALQQRLKDLRRAFNDFFAVRQPNKGFPQFKKKYQHDRTRYQNYFKKTFNQWSVEVQHNRIRLPKVGWVRMHQSQRLRGHVKYATLSRDADGWYVSITCELTQAEQRAHLQSLMDREVLSNVPPTSIIGGDLGVRNLLALSDGTTFGGCTKLKQLDTRLKSLQRALARKQKGSNSYDGMMNRIARTHQCIRDARLAHLREIVTVLRKNHAVVVVLEDLKVQRMTKSARGTVQNPGVNVQQTSNLNRSILDRGWGPLGRLLDSALEPAGGFVLRVPPHYTSQTCSACGHTAAANRVKDRFHCEECQYEKDADINAAMNILERGLRQLEGSGLGAT